MGVLGWGGLRQASEKNRFCRKTGGWPAATLGVSPPDKLCGNVPLCTERQSRGRNVVWCVSSWRLGWRAGGREAAGER